MKEEWPRKKDEKKVNEYNKQVMKLSKKQNWRNKNITNKNIKLHKKTQNLNFYNESQE